MHSGDVTADDAAERVMAQLRELHRLLRQGAAPIELTQFLYRIDRAGYERAVMDAKFNSLTDPLNGSTEPTTDF